MAEIKNFPNNADEYIGAENVMKWLHGRTSGVFAAGNNLAVTSQGGMDIAVSDGVGWIANSESDGTVFWNDAFKSTGTQLKLSLELADAYNPRIDRVIVSWDTVDYADKPQIVILKGAPSSTPTPPALTRTANRWQISLARISVGAAVGGVTAANITDERLNADVCGLVTAALEIDSSMANSQFLDILDQLESHVTSVVNNTETQAAQAITDTRNQADTAITQTQTQASTTITETQNQAERLLAAIQAELDGLNSGTEVMLKSVYDKNNDGIVDEAENDLRLYKAEILDTDWTYNGAFYTASVPCVSVNDGSAIPSDYMLSAPMCLRDLNPTLNSQYLELLNLINSAIIRVLNSGKISIFVSSQPTLYLELYFYGKKESDITGSNSSFILPGGDPAVKATAENANSTANSALSKANAAQTAANNANSAANTANTKANAALPKSGGAMTGTLSNANSAQVRNIIVSTEDLTAGTSTLETGTIYLVYE